jgi:hypothetical protein
MLIIYKIYYTDTHRQWDVNNKMDAIAMATAGDVI